MTLTDMHVKLRQAAPADFPVILDLLTRCGLHTGSVTPGDSTYWIAELDGVPAADLLRLHGVGPKAVAVLREALAERGLTLA